MKTQTKSITGKLLDISNNDFLADVSVDITLSTPQNEEDKPKYEVFLVVDGF